MTLSPVPERAPADTGFRVCVRARPALPHEHDEYVELRRDAVRVDSSNEITVGGDDSIGPDFARSTTYRFDRVFAPDVGQAAVYEHCARPAVTSLFDGFNSTVMAYGQTGSGKTHTLGTAQGCDPGLIQNTLSALFASGAQQLLSVEASFVEIYQERVKDLLAPAGEGAHEKLASFSKATKQKVASCEQATPSSPRVPAGPNPNPNPSRHSASSPRLRAGAP